jgi:hypothetical protein
MKARILPSACLAVLPLVFVLSCKIPGSSSPTDSTASAATVFLTDYSGDFSYSLDVGKDPKNVYFVFSNKNVNTSADAATVKNSVGSIKVNGTTIASSTAQPAGGPSASSTKAKDFLARSNRNINAVLASGGIKVSGSVASKASAPSYDTEVTTPTTTSGSSLNDLNASDALSAVSATCRLVRTVSNSKVSRTLNIWVADNCWYATGSSKKHLVTDTMVTALADAFLKDGSNDIYAYDTGILGPEWGTPQGQYASDLIPFDGNITILLSDIENDNNDNGNDGVVVGYFWDGNNFYSSYVPGSNQRIMFVIDAVLFGNPDPSGKGTGDSGYNGSSWSTTGSYWPEECVSTLAHEFQHMIQFYRKGVVVRGDCKTADTWINEMCSQLVEDLVATKLQGKGPRGVAYTDGSAGASDNESLCRIHYFNALLSSDDRQLTKTSNYDAYDYSFSYAFGAWLMRNYGGAQFVKNVVYSSATDSDCITNAVNSYSGQSLSMGDLISRWAVAVLGSSRTDMPLGYRFNTGGWTYSSASGMTYSLGSIDFFNYNPAPGILTGSGSTSAIAASSNVYYLAKSGMTGSDKWTLSLPQGVGFNVYVTQP